MALVCLGGILLCFGRWFAVWDTGTCDWDSVRPYGCAGGLRVSQCASLWLVTGWLFGWEVGRCSCPECKGEVDGGLVGKGANSN